MLKTYYNHAKVCRDYLANQHERNTLLTSGGMEPAFCSRGDLLLLTNYRSEPIRAGDVVVFQIKDRAISIVHRVIRVHEKYVVLFFYPFDTGALIFTATFRDDGSVKFLTKGDINLVDDRGLYPSGQLWLEKKNIFGKVKGYAPFPIVH